MGNTSSGQRAGEVAEPSAKTCYYELLSVDRTATQEEIKKAYRRKALELHPDKNYGDVERATKLFAEVQAAYEVLSDPQERAWYDSHREAILRGDDGHGSAADGFTSGGISITTSEDVYSWFSLFPSKSKIDYSDNPDGFYTTLRQIFEKLAGEEVSVCEEQELDVPYFPGFGDSKSVYEDHVKVFYARWSGFRTSKSFAWKDRYKLSDAPDRRIRRLMEKENKKSREEAIREFNDTVRQFVQFVKKRDPRYTPVYTGMTEAQVQAAILQASRDQSARARARTRDATKLNEYKVADWMEPVEPSRVDQSDEFPEEEEANEVTLYECVACKKVFRTEAQYVAHEKSNKHKKVVYQLRKRMKKEDKDLRLNEDIGHTSMGVAEEEPATYPLQTDSQELHSTDKATADPYSGNEKRDLHISSINQKLKAPGSGSGEQNHQRAEEENREIEEQQENPDPEEGEEEEGDDEVESEVDDDYVSISQFQARVLGKGNSKLTDDFAQISLDHENNGDVPTTKDSPKVGKAKLKREKKKAVAAMLSEHKCASCHQAFSSRQKLFNHLKESPSHATPIKQESSSGRNKKNGKK